MFADIGFTGLEQFHDHSLSEPDGIILEPHIQFDPSVLALVDQELPPLHFIHFGFQPLFVGLDSELVEMLAEMFVQLFLVFLLVNEQRTVDLVVHHGIVAEHGAVGDVADFPVVAPGWVKQEALLQA